MATTSSLRGRRPSGHLWQRPARPGELSEEIFEAARRAERLGVDDLRRAQVRIETAVAPIEDWWQDHDLLVTPTTFRPAWPLGGETPGVAEVGDLAAPFSLTGQPAMSTSPDTRRPADRRPARRPSWK